MKTVHVKGLIYTSAAIAAFFVFLFQVHFRVNVFTMVGAKEIEEIATTSPLYLPVAYEKKVLVSVLSDVERTNTLSIPSIGVDAQVKTMGLEPDGKMAVPNNYTDVGLYGGGAKPGERGSAVMGAHVDNGSAVDGVFKKLSNLKKGDAVYYFNEVGEKIPFKVTYVKVYDRDAAVEEVFLPDDKARLNLITCHGTWLPGKNTYDKRLVVFTERE